MEGNYRIRFDEIVFSNRWRRKKYSRDGTWVIFGVQKWWAGPRDFCYKFCFFGLELHLWFFKEFNIKG